MTPEKRVQMLDQHDGFDVLNPDGLKEWQNHVCDIICRNVPREKAQPSFKGKKASKAQKAELARLRKEGEQQALSIDVGYVYFPANDMRLTHPLL